MFLSRGIDMDVLAQEKDPAIYHEDQFKQFPRLIFYGYITNATIYQLLADGQIFTNSKIAGFKGVEFASKFDFSTGSGGRWIYDLAGPKPPKCDVNSRLCL